MAVAAKVLSTRTSVDVTVKIETVSGLGPVSIVKISPGKIPKAKKSTKGLVKNLLSFIKVFPAVVAKENGHDARTNTKRNSRNHVRSRPAEVRGDDGTVLVLDAGTGIRAIFRNWHELGRVPPQLTNDKARKEEEDIEFFVD